MWNRKGEGGFTWSYPTVPPGSRSLPVLCKDQEYAFPSNKMNRLALNFGHGLAITIGQTNNENQHTNSCLHHTLCPAKHAFLVFPCV